MNNVNTLLAMAFALSVFIFCMTIIKKKKEPFCVTYHVSVHALRYCKLLIIYNDSTGLVEDTCSGGSWEKKVCLHPYEIASLCVKEKPDPEHYFQLDNEEEIDPAAKAWLTKPVSIWIEHEKKVTLTAGKGLMQISMQSPDAR